MANVAGRTRVAYLVLDEGSKSVFPDKRFNNRR